MEKMLPLSHTSHKSLNFMKNVKNRKKKTQKLSDAAPCTHKTIFSSFHAHVKISKASTVEFYFSCANSTTVKTQMAVRVRFCCHFTLDLLICEQEPAPLPMGGRDRKFANWWAVSDIHFVPMETVPEQAGLQRDRVEFGRGCSAFGFGCRGMPVGLLTRDNWHVLLLEQFYSNAKSTALHQSADPPWPLSSCKCEQKTGGGKKATFSISFLKLIIVMVTQNFTVKEVGTKLDSKND